MNTTTQGAFAEQQAARYLTIKGYKIVARNFRATGGEIDIVAQQRNTLVFVEVKQRASQAFGGPLAAVTKTKQKRISCASIQFIKTHANLKYNEIRFDVICILPAGIEHIENAFFTYFTFNCHNYMLI